MPLPILQTKLYLPLASDGMIFRPKLLERLQLGLKSKVTIISAPPGFGKTTLLSAWLATNEDSKVAWYSLDEDDNDSARFFAYLAAALRTVEPASVSTLTTLLEAGSARPSECAAALLNDFAETISGDVTLVLDDYHHITQQPIHDALAYLIDHLPRHLHLAFLSRADPLIPLEGGEVCKDIRFGCAGGQVVSQPKSVGKFAAANGCDLDPQPVTLPVEVEDGTFAEQQTYANCAGGAQVVAYIVHNGGHTWPPRPGQLPAAGAQSRNLDVTRLIVEFFFGEN